MFASCIYYFYLRNLDLPIARKIARGLLIMYVMYYVVFANFFAGYVYQNTFWWILCVDIFALGVLVMKFKSIKFRDLTKEIIK